MTNQFDQIIDRRGTGSVKWDFIMQGDDIDYRPIRGTLPDEASRLPLWVADMDFPSPQPVIDALQDRIAHGVFGYDKPLDSYYDAIIAWMQRRHGWTVEKESILTTPGVVPGINFIMQAITKPGDGVIIQTPVYHPFYSSIERNGRLVRRNPLQLVNGRYEIDFEQFESLAAEPNTTVFLLCSPHNPVGRVWNSAELRRLADICATHDLLIISDEIHHDLIYSWSSFTTFGVACPDAMDRTIVCTAPSKTFNVPGLKTANAFISNPQLRQAVQESILRNGFFGVNALGPVALEAAYRYGEPWLAEMWAYVEANYHFTVEALAQTLPAVEVIRPEGTYLLWLDFRKMGLSAETLNTTLMEQAGVYLNNGTDFGEDGTGFMRLNLTCQRQTLAAALNRIEAALGQGVRSAE